MGTGMNDRTVVSNNLGSMYGMLVFFESSLDELHSSIDPGKSVGDLFPDETETLAEVQLGLGMATKSFEKLVSQLSGVDKTAFVAGASSVAQSMVSQSLSGAVKSNE